MDQTFSSDITTETVECTSLFQFELVDQEDAGGETIDGLACIDPFEE